MLLHKIKDLCAAKGISMKELSEKAGVPYTGLKEWGNSMPAADKLFRVATILDVTVEELLKEEE